MSANARKKDASSTSSRQPNISSTADTFTNAPVPDLSQLTNDQFLSWGSNNNSVPSYADTTGIFTGGLGMQDPLANQDSFNSIPSLQHSNSQLVRRNLNRELTVRGRDELAGQPLQQQQEMWSGFAEGHNGAVINLDEDNDQLTERAAAAEKDARAKKPPKSIPPFIQKLSSFLDESRNTDLIRWADDGNSFIVLDEDRFANELIPELFKHNNYASFVRQLNMYGFHKNVGLSDNSMRASETKAKRPSVYSNAYFKRGRPELLWLIQKPKNETTGTKKKKTTKPGEQNVDSDEDARDSADAPARMDMAQVSQGAFGSLQREVAQLQRNQHQITSMLTRLRDDNNQYLRQAGAMVAAHERHENSINAILTFLATFYNNRNVDNPGNLGAMFSGGMQNNQTHGNIVEMGDFDGSGTTPEPAQMQVMRTPARRPLALLPPPQARSRQPSAGSDNHRASTSTPVENLQVPHANRSTQPNVPGGRLPSSAKSTPTPAPVSPGSGVNDIMNVINNANAARSSATNTSESASTASPQFDFDAALQDYQTSNGKAPLTDEQRNTVLSMMASNSGTTTPHIPAPGTDGINPWANGLEHFQNNSAQIDLLQRMQEEQDWKMQSLADRLQPLSPNGSIPGLEGIASPNLSRTGSFNLGSMGPPNGSTQQGQPMIPHLKAAPSSDFDINKFLNTDYFPDFDDTTQNFGDATDFTALDSPLGGAQHEIESAPTPAGLFSENGQNDTDMSGLLNPGAGDDIHGREGGRILGSVGSSAAGSGATSPKVKTEDEEESAPTTLPSDLNTRKRRRVGE